MMVTHRQLFWRGKFALAVMLSVTFTPWAHAAAPGQASLLTVPHPKLEIFEQGVREALSDAREALDRHDAASEPEKLAIAYGQLGMLYQAYDMLEQAEPCYVNAQRLAPQHYQWPYLLAYQYQLNGRLQEATEYYRRALEIDPQNIPALIHLGQALNKLNRHDEARPRFQKALALEPGNAAALEGLAEISYRDKDYAATIRQLDEALAAQPNADRLHYLLGMAHRRLGNMALARKHLALRGKGSPYVTDPAVSALNELLDTSQVHIKQGVAAYQAGDFAQAASAYRRALKSNPDDLQTRLALAWALELSDDAERALQQINTVLDSYPGEPKAHYLKGAILAQAGALSDAASHLSTAVAAAPDAALPRLVLATVLMNLGEYLPASRHYAALAGQQKQDELLLFRLGMARLAGGACAEAIEPLENALRLRPGSLTLTQAVLRAYAICPQAEMASANMALLQSQRLFDRTRRWDAAETLAMALAANGRFAEAATLQDEVIRQAQQTGQPAYIMNNLRHNRQRYVENGLADRAWPFEHPVFKPAMISREERQRLDK